MKSKDKLSRQPTDSRPSCDQSPGSLYDADRATPRRSLQPIQYRYDFDIGYLSKSPCQGCELRSAFPRCINRCRALDQIHTLLTGTVSCSRNS